MKKSRSIYLLGIMLSLLLNSTLSSAADGTPVGTHDSSNCTASSGWACDPDDYSQPLEVHFYKDGPYGGSGVFIGATTANQRREEAVGVVCGGNSTHGFVYTTPDSLKDGVAHTIYAYAINTGPQGSNPLLGGSPKTIICSSSDTIPPIISITLPTDGTMVSGIVNISVSASDNVGVARVEFYVDGLLQGTDTTSPYSYIWDTTNASNGSHTLLAKTFDAVGNSASDSVTVIVSNSNTSLSSIEVWYSPNIGSTDMLNLFTKSDRWVYARGKTQIFKFYQQHVTASTNVECPICGNNLLPNLINVQAFSKLRNWGIDTAIETGALKSWSCDSITSSEYAKQAIQNVESNGGTVRYIAMDEPFIGGGMFCYYTINQSAYHTAEFIRLVRNSYPSVLIGDIEPYPYFSASELQDWIAALEVRGVALSFFHVDVDRAHAAIIGANVEADLQDLKSFCEARNIPFGVIFWGEDGSSNQAYYSNTIQWIGTVKSAVGLPQHSIFQSWVESSGGGNTVPINLPENDPSIYSHTRLINDGWSILADNNAQFVVQSVPATMMAGQIYSVSITVMNNSPLTWTSKTGYKLGTQNPQDNTTWGLGRVELVRRESIEPGQQKTFTFDITAPSIPGIYNFQWRMMQELVEWFGDSTPNLEVTVQ